MTTGLSTKGFAIDLESVLLCMKIYMKTLRQIRLELCTLERSGTLSLKVEDASCSRAPTACLDAGDHCSGSKRFE